MHEKDSVFLRTLRNFFSYSIITEVLLNELNLQKLNQRHLLMAFLSVRLNDTQLGWSFMDKEVYAIMTAIGRMF